MFSQSLSQRIDTAWSDRLQHFNRSQRLADRPNAREPGIAREIVRSGKCHGRRRCQPRPELDASALAHSSRRSVSVDGNAHSRWERGIGRHERKANLLLRGERLGPCNVGNKGHDHGPIEPGRRNPVGSHPGETASQGHRKTEPSDRPLETPTLQREAGDREATAQKYDGRPFARSSKTEPACDARAEANGQPQGQLAALALQEAFHSLARCADTRLPIAPSTLWKRRTRYVRGARPLHCTTEKRGKRA